jgi:hypothetical protein
MKGIGRCTVEGCVVIVVPSDVRNVLCIAVNKRVWNGPPKKVIALYVKIASANMAINPRVPRDS